MPSPAILDSLRAAAQLARDQWEAEMDPTQRAERRQDYYRACQAVVEAEHRARHPLPDAYKAIGEKQP